MRRLANGFARAWKAIPTGQRWLVVVGILFFAVVVPWLNRAVERDRAEFDRTHACHWETRQKTVRVLWLTGWLDEQQSDPIVGPAPKYKKIGDRYYGVETERVQMCVEKAAWEQDPTCKLFYEREPGGGSQMSAFNAAITSRHRADGALAMYWRNLEQKKKWERCLPNTIGPLDVLPPETPEQFEAREALNRTPFNSPDYKKLEKAAYPEMKP